MSAAVALAAAASLLLVDPGMALIDEDVAAGRIDEDTAAVERFYRLLRPDDSAPRYQAGPWVAEPQCATTALADVHARWDDLSPTERHRIDQTADPSYRGWLRSGGISWEQGDVHAARTAERATCFSPGDIDTGYGPYEHRTDSPDGWFQVHWNEVGTLTEQRMGWMAGWFDESFRIEVEELGFFGPDNITTHQLLVIVDDIGSDSVFGFTGRFACGLSDAMAYIVMNSRFVDDQVSLRPTAAHELFHAVQQVYGFQEFWSRGSPNRWWLEASAVYAATVVYPTDQARHAGQVIRWYLEPWKSMTTFDDGGHQYGMVVWPLSLAETLGDPVWHRDFWESLRGREGYTMRDEFDSFLTDRGTSFDAEYTEFLRRSAVGDLGDNPYIVGPVQVDEFYGEGLTASHDSGDYPLDERVDGDSGLDRPQYLGVNHVWLESRGVDRDQGLVFEFWGNAERNDEEVSWAVELIGIDEERPEDSLTLELEPDLRGGNLDKWRGSVILNDFRRGYDGLLVTVSPTSEFGDGGVTWGYAARLHDSTGERGFADAPVDEEIPVEGTGCEGPPGCEDGPFPAAAAVGLILLGGPLRRRRRRSPADPSTRPPESGAAR